MYIVLWVEEGDNNPCCVWEQYCCEFASLVWSWWWLVFGDHVHLVLLLHVVMIFCIGLGRFGRFWKVLEALGSFLDQLVYCVLVTFFALLFVLFIGCLAKQSCRVWMWLLQGKLSLELEVDQFGCQISSPRMRLRGSVTVVAHGVIMCFASLAEGVVFSDVISSAREVLIFSTPSWR